MSNSDFKIENEVFRNRLVTYCNTHPKRIQAISEDPSKSKDPNRQVYFSVSDILCSDYNCKPFFFTWTLANKGSLREQWEQVAHLVEYIQETLINEFLVVGGIISLEPHKNTSLNAKRGKNTKAGMPHVHAVIWFYHMFLNPSIQKFKLKLFKKGVATKVNELKTNLDTVKALLYTIKDRNDPLVKELAKNLTGWKNSTQIWIAHQEPKTWLIELHEAFGEQSSFVFEDLRAQFPTTRRYADETLQIAELFRKVFIKQGLAVKDGHVYEKQQHTRFSWRFVSTLDNWLANAFNINHPPAYLEKLKDSLTWLSKQGAINKQSLPVEIFPRLRPQLFLIEFQDRVYNLTKAETLSPDLVDQSTQTLCSVDSSWDDLQPPLNLLGLVSILVAWGLPFNDIGYPVKVEQSEDRFKNFTQESQEQSFHRVVEALQRFGGLFHPELNRKQNPALLLRGDPSTFKTFLILTLLKAVFGMQNIDTLSRNINRFNTSALRKEAGQPFILLLDDLRWDKLGMHLPDFLNLVDGNIVPTEKKFEAAVVSALKGSIAVTTNSSMSDLIEDHQDVLAMQSRFSEVKVFPLRIQPPLVLNQKLIDIFEEEAVAFAVLVNAVFCKRSKFFKDVQPALPSAFFETQPVSPGDLRLVEQGEFTLSHLIRELDLKQ